MSLKFKTKHGVIDSEKEPVVILFENNNEIIGIINNLLDMLKPDIDNSKNRKFLICPDTMSETDAILFMDILNKKG